jgi:leucyl aminopeptidase
MTVSVTTDAPATIEADLLLVPLSSSPSDAAIGELETLFGATMRRAAEDFKGKTGDVLRVYADGTEARIVLIGTGTPTTDEDNAVEQLRRAAAAGASEARSVDATTVAIMLPRALDAGEPAAYSEHRAASALAEGLVLGAYRFTQYKTQYRTDAKEDGAAGRGGNAGLSILVHAHRDADPSAVESGAERGVHLAEAACFARDLVNLSPNDKTARLFARRIQASGETHGYDVDVWDEDRIRAEGFGGLLAVNLGSVEPPTFTVLEHKPDNAANAKPVVLAGKGVVFDTGGLSLKDTKGSMDLMKSDMAGAAAVVGAFEALTDLNVPLHVIGLVPATDNRPGENAYVPGDVITMYAGTTVEVLNTDAEGRLLLADALAYAKQYDPEMVIDLATLTGAQVVSLGSEAAAVMTSETDGSAERLYQIQRAGERSGERVHPLPMYDAYKDLLDSNVADIKNVGGREAGCITAGKFLEHFVDYPWMHLDIAGPAFLTSSKPYRPAGGTGFGVRLLLSFLENYATAKSA